MQVLKLNTDRLVPREKFTLIPVIKGFNKYFLKMSLLSSQNWNKAVS